MLSTVTGCLLSPAAVLKEAALFVGLPLSRHFREEARPASSSRHLPQQGKLPCVRPRPKPRMLPAAMSVPGRMVSRHRSSWAPPFPPSAPRRCYKTGAGQWPRSPILQQGFRMDHITGQPVAFLYHQVGEVNPACTIRNHRLHGDAYHPLILLCQNCF